MPFLIASIAIIYYTPYIVFITANQDLISLRKEIKRETTDADKIAKHYFNHRTNPPRAMALRVLLNILVKVLYFAANLITLLGIDNLFNREFLSYGQKWVKWSSLDNHLAFDYMGMRDFPKPGKKLFSISVFYTCPLFHGIRSFVNNPLSPVGPV